MPQPAPDRLVVDDLVIDFAGRRLTRGGREQALEPKAFAVLALLAAAPGRVFTREILLSRVWGYEYYGGARTVDVHIRRLRAKLGEEHAGMIQTVRSVGYKFGESRWGA